MPSWLETIATVSLIASFLCSVIVVLDLLLGHKQHMWIMDVVWPITALYSGPLGLLAYYTWGRLSTERTAREAMERGQEPPGRRRPFWQSTAVGATHCGSGCTLGDIAAEWTLFFVPLALFGHKIFAAWVLDYILAFIFGIAFQYFAIQPMRKLPPAQGIVAAIKADALSLTAWQIGMYGWMAIAVFLVFGEEIPKTDPVFWFMMQIAMLAGFLTSYPVNWWLLRKGIKELM